MNPTARIAKLSTRYDFQLNVNFKAGMPHAGDVRFIYMYREHSVRHSIVVPTANELDAALTQLLDVFEERAEELTEASDEVIREILGDDADLEMFRGQTIKAVRAWSRAV